MRRFGFGVVAAAVVLLLAAPAGAASSPNPAFTPGVVDSRVTQANIATTICRSGYTTTIRDVSTQTKHKVYVEYGISTSAQRGYVIDHLVPLEVGGANDIHNLWPEPKGDATVKDRLEGQVHDSVCRRTLTLAEGQARFFGLVPPAAGAATMTLPPVTVPPTTAAPPTQSPPTAPPVGAPRIVTAGSFCAYSEVGASAQTSAGTPMVCATASKAGTPYTQPRWRSP